MNYVGSNNLSFRYRMFAESDYIYLGIRILVNTQFLCLKMFDVYHCNDWRYLQWFRLIKILNMEEYWNCRNYTLESKFGEYPGVFIILTILMIIGTFLYWVLRCYFNSIEDHRMNINIFLNKRITEIILAVLWTIVKILY